MISHCILRMAKAGKLLLPLSFLMVGVCCLDTVPAPSQDPVGSGTSTTPLESGPSAAFSPMRLGDDGGWILGCCFGHCCVLPASRGVGLGKEKAHLQTANKGNDSCKAPGNKQQLQVCQEIA